MGSHFNIKVGRKYTQLWHSMLYYFKKYKNATEMQKKKICAGYGESDVIDRTCQKRFMKFLGTIDILANYFFAVGCLMHWNMFSSTPGLYPLEPIVGDSRHTQMS